MFAYFVWLVFREFDKWGIKEISEKKQTTPVIYVQNTDTSPV